MKRRGGKREGAGRKNFFRWPKLQEKLIKNIVEQISVIYIWKIAFSQPRERFRAEGTFVNDSDFASWPLGLELRRRQELFQTDVRYLYWKEMS